MPEPPRSVARVAAELGTTPVAWSSPAFGLSAAERHVVGFADGTRAFVKAATTAETAGWLRHERALLGLVGGTFGPDVLAWLDDPVSPVLATTDLSTAYWPAASGTTVWRPGDLEAVLGRLEDLRTWTVDDTLPLVPWPEPAWTQLIEKRVPVELGLCSPSWLERHAATLVGLDADATPRATALVHGDVRSDNLCVLADGAIRLVDWSVAGRGDPLHDLLLVLPTLRLEGGPEPQAVLAEPAELVVRFAGPTLVMAVGDRPMPGWLREVMHRLAVIQLAWLGHLLDDPPDRQP